MSEIVERVARALCQVDEQDGGAPWDYEMGGDPKWNGQRQERYRNAARAAIAAMREPTKAMLAASRDMSPASADTIGAEYRAMIDAALQE